MSRSLRELYESSPFSSAQAPYVEEQYERFLDDPSSVAPEWREFFGQFGPPPKQTSRRLQVPTVAPVPAPSAPRAASGTDANIAGKQSAVSRLIQFYANRGHLIADIDPLGLKERPMPKVLDPAYVGLTEADM
ncbi:MAG: 2-oxoglutarate dehydrogenase E1 subunit family protein, partial [Phyllobacterium sp.]